MCQKTKEILNISIRSSFTNLSSFSLFPPKSSFSLRRKMRLKEKGNKKNNSHLSKEKII